MARAWHLMRRPNGAPVAEDFALKDYALPALDEGMVHVRNRWLSVDPYMRGRMNDVKSYVPPFALDAPMDGGAVGEVEHEEALQADAGRDDPRDEAEARRVGVVVACDHAADGEPRIIPRERERGIEMVAADIVEIDVDAVGCRGGQALEQGSGAIVDHLVGAERADEGAFVLTAG